MPVKKDASGRRSVEAEVEVPGTPEEVWRAIATGPGISSWFVPTEVEEREGGAIVCDFGPGMESLSTITTWEPPHRFVADSRDDMGPDDPTVATEWIVEARSGGHLRRAGGAQLVHQQRRLGRPVRGSHHGWLAFFRILRLYLTHFRGQPGSAFQLMGVAPEPKAEAWEALTGPLGLDGAEVGQRVSTTPARRRSRGSVEWAGQPAWPEELLLRLDEPAPGIAHLVPHPMGGQVYLTIRFFFYGDRRRPLSRAPSLRGRRG